MRRDAEDRRHPSPRITGDFAQHSQSLCSSSSSSSPSPFFLLPLSPFLTELPPEHLLFTRHCPGFYGELASDAYDPLSVGPGTCFEISEVHLLSFPDVLFLNYPVTQFPSLPPGCPKSLVISPHPGLPSGKCLGLRTTSSSCLPTPVSKLLFFQDLSDGCVGIKLILLTALTLCCVLNCVPQKDTLKS